MLVRTLDGSIVALMRQLMALAAMVASACGGGRAPAEPPVSSPPSERAIAAPLGFVEASFGDVVPEASGSGDGPNLAILSKDGRSATTVIDETTKDFVERFRKDPAAALAWAKAQTELAAALDLAPRVERAEYGVERGAFVLRLYDQSGPLETTNAHVVVVVSGAPLFVAVEMFEGFPY